MFSLTSQRVLRCHGYSTDLETLIPNAALREQAINALYPGGGTVDHDPVARRFGYYDFAITHDVNAALGTTLATVELLNYALEVGAFVFFVGLLFWPRCFGSGERPFQVQRGCKPGAATRSRG